MRSLVVSLVLTLLASSASAADPKAAAAARKDIQNTFGFVPEYMKRVPDHAIAGAWEEMRGLQLNPLTALPAKQKELIAIAVAAQAPCERSVYAHTQFAKLHGATDAEIAEAVMIGAVTRHWSGVIDGLQQDEGKFRAELTKIVAAVKKGGAAKSIEVVDGKSALTDIQQRWGVVPEFLRVFPAEGVAGAWKMERDFQMADGTALEPRVKTLISLAVATQISCANCVIAETAFARVAGANDREIHEAIAVGALVRHWSTWLVGMQIDAGAHRRDVDRMVRGMKKGVPANNPS
jgi:AhpD family alkylhydroperoxidase